MPNPIKKEIGFRFRTFREVINKTQTRLAGELNIYQSTITNVEVGKTFPNIKYLLYLFDTYNLNINWLLTGNGDMFIEEKNTSPVLTTLSGNQPGRTDEVYRMYEELFELMKIPLIEQLILAKLVEIKVFARTEINEFREKEKKLKKA